MRNKKFILPLLSFACLVLFTSCSSHSDYSYIGTRHLPLQYDGSRIYGGMGRGVLSYVSMDTGTYAPLCTNPTCTHSVDSTACEARITEIILAMTLDGDNNIIVCGRDFVDPYTYDAIKVDLDTGKQEYVVKQNPNNIGAMMVVKDNLYFISQLDDGGKNEGKHSVCYTSLKGGKVKTISLPDNDYYFAGADENYLYLKAFYTQSIIAVDYNNNYEYHTLYTFSETQSPDCYIKDDSIYIFNNRENTEITASHKEYPEIEDSFVTRSFPLYTFAKYDILSNTIVSETDSHYLANPWGYIAEDYIYLPHFSPTCAAPIENSDGTMSYPIHRNTGVDVIDKATLTVSETIDFPDMDINAIVYADSEKIVFYSNRYDDELKFFMGWMDRKTGEIHEYNVDGVESHQ